MADNITVNIAATENASDAIINIGDATTRTERVIVQSMGSTEDAFDTAARGSNAFGGALDMASGAGTQLADGLSGVGDAISAVTDLQDAGRQKAQRLAQAQVDVGQALTDMTQASVDAEQATNDLKQAQVDGAQAGIDAKQAAIDLETANLDVADATKEYNKAVKESGPNSAEARRALADLNQAKLDGEQAQTDLTQAQIDGQQAQTDGKQAASDATQATLDLKQAQIDLNDAQHESKPPTGLQEFGEQAGLIAPVILGAVGIIDLFTLANTALSGSFIASAASSAGAAIATAAHATIAGVATAAQWAWNAAIAFATSPITLVIVGIGLLVAAVVWVATQTTWFQTIWSAVWNYLIEPVMSFGGRVIGFIAGVWNTLSSGVGWVKDRIVGAFSAAGNFAAHALDVVMDIPGRVGNAFASIGNAIFSPFKWAFNMVAWAWNNTAGRIGFTVPNWVPGIGGSGWSLPKMPSLAIGGEIIRTGAVLAHAGERILPASTRNLGGDTTGQGQSGATADVSGTITIELGVESGSDSALMREIIKGLSVRVQASGGTLERLISVTPS